MPRYHSFFVYCNSKININNHCDDLGLVVVFLPRLSACWYFRTLKYPHLNDPRDQYLKIEGFRGSSRLNRSPEVGSTFEIESRRKRSLNKLRDVP